MTAEEIFCNLSEEEESIVISHSPVYQEAWGFDQELARVTGMLNNEKFVSKAPAAKIAEGKAKQDKYAQMMEQVKERLGQL